METQRLDEPHERLLGLLGLALRGGRLSVGVDATRSALKRGEVRAVVLASDASRRAVDKVVALSRGKGVTVVKGPVADLIGQRLGRPPVMAVGVRDRGLAAGLVALGDSRGGS